jgi:hypothetical protein
MNLADATKVRLDTVPNSLDLFVLLVFQFLKLHIKAALEPSVPQTSGTPAKLPPH